MKALWLFIRWFPCHPDKNAYLEEKHTNRTTKERERSATEEIKMRNEWASDTESSNNTLAGSIGPY